MKHQTLSELQAVAAICPDQPAMSQIERLERWAKLLEQEPGRILRTLHETEYQPEAVRVELRSEQSPISVAFADPVLRDAGLQNDTYGEARRFFGLSDHELHEIVCYCHFGATISAAQAACNVRSTIRQIERPSRIDQLRRYFVGA